MGQGAVGVRERRRHRGRHSRRERARRRDRDLLAEDRPRRDLPAVDDAGDAQAGARGEQRAEVRIGRRGAWPPRAGRRRDRRARGRGGSPRRFGTIGEREARGDATLIRRQLQDRGAAGQRQRPAVRAIPHLLHARDRAGGEEVQDGGAVEGLGGGQVHHVGRNGRRGRNVRRPERPLWCPGVKIVSVMTTDSSGGAEFAALEMLEALRRGNETVMLTDRPGIGATRREGPAAGDRAGAFAVLAGLLLRWPRLLGRCAPRSSARRPTTCCSSTTRRSS